MDTPSVAMSAIQVVNKNPIQYKTWATVGTTAADKTALSKMRPTRPRDFGMSNTESK